MRVQDDVPGFYAYINTSDPVLKAAVAYLMGGQATAEAACPNCKTDRYGERNCTGRISRCAYTNEALAVHDRQAYAAGRALIRAYAKLLAEKGKARPVNHEASPMLPMFEDRTGS
jgi:hypothetical protein